MTLEQLRAIVVEGSYNENATLIRKLYFDTFGVRFKSKCSNCLQDAVIELITDLSKKKDIGEYQLHHYTAVYDEKTKRAYNHITINDEVAKRVLELHPELSFKFKKMPE